MYSLQGTAVIELRYSRNTGLFIQQRTAIVEPGYRRDILYYTVTRTQLL